MEHRFRGGPRIRGPPRMPARGSHQPPQQLIPPPARIMNSNVNAWQHNNMPQHYPQSPDEGLNYQQPMGDGYHAPAYPQYPATMPSPEVFTPYPTAQIYAPAMYHPPPPPPIETQQVPVYTQMQITNKNPRGMQLSRDGIITCSNCRHRNALADSELVKKDEEISQLKIELSLLRTKLQLVEEDLQRRMPSLQPQEAAAVESALQQSSEGLAAVSSKSLLSPNAMEFNPVPKPQNGTVTASNDSAAEVPVVSAKGVSDEPSCEVQAEDGISYEPVVEEPVVQCEVKSVQTSPVREEEEDFQASVKEVVDGGFGEPKSEPQDLETESQPETTQDIKPVVANDEWCEEVPPHQNNNTRATNLSESKSTNQRQGSRRGSDSVPFGGYGRGKINRGRDQDHFNSDRNYSKNNRANQNYRGSNQRNHDDGIRENWRGSSNKDWPKPDGQRDTNSPQQRDEQGSQGTSARRWENHSHQSQRSDRNRFNRDETSKDGNREQNNRGNPDADGFQTQAPRGRGNRGPEDNTAKFHYKTKPQDNNKEFTGGSRSGKGGSPVKDVVMEHKGDLFSAPADFALAHCVARDFRMGSGIAVKFRNEFKRVSELLDQDVGVGGCAHLVEKERYIFYMVTKELSSGKPTYDSLRDSLRELRKKCQRFDVKKLAMPRIGCGLDRLDWTRVKHMVNETFQDCDMEVHAYEFNVDGLPEAEGNRQEAKSGTAVRYEKMNLFNIANQTALLFLGTEDGYMDSVATSLDARFNFATTYKKSPKTVGKVWRHELSQYCIYGIIVAKTYNKNKVLFSVLDECFRMLSKMIRQDRFEFMGMEVSKDWNCEDTLFTEKVTVLLRNMLPRIVKQLWVCFPDEKLDPHGLCARYVKPPQNPPA